MLGLRFGLSFEHSLEIIVMHLQTVINAWNSRADEFNTWDTLSADEMVEFTIKFVKTSGARPLDPVAIRELRVSWADSTKAKLMGDAYQFCRLVDERVDLEMRIADLVSVLKRHHDEALKQPQYKGSPVYLDTMEHLDV